MSDDTTPSGPAVPDPSQHPSRERLQAYLDGRLGPADAENLAAHLEACATCAVRLPEATRPVELPRPPVADAQAWNERRMRRAVRGTLLRTAITAAVLLVAGALVLPLIGWLVVHPLLIDRGNRLPAAVTATIDLPVMTIPGAEVTSVESNPGTLRRITQVEVQRTVGARAATLGRFTTRLGPVGMSADRDTPVTLYGPALREPVTDLTPVGFDPERLGDGTAITVELTWHDPMPLAAADAVADGADDVVLTWVGFRIPGGDPFDPAWRLGYSACATVPEFVRTITFGGYGGSGGFRVFPPQQTGARHALIELQRAAVNLAAVGWLDDEPIGDGGALAEIAYAAEWLAATGPGVSSLVVTGPAGAVAAVIDQHAPDQVDLLEVDFDLSPPDGCG